MSNHTLRRFFLVALLLLAAGSPAPALEWREKHLSSLATRHAPLATGQAVVLADFWSIGHFFTSGGRTRIVQMCVVAMCIALFIMMRKLHG